ncbi:MAG: tetratricopeptide repeat protein [Rhodospirillaceae bacterium]|nr:tetratricopeptide repeat protein [Rhodospirillaceae bacterium]
MLQDRYGNDLTTDSADARDAYVEGMDRFLAAAPDVEAAFQQALAADPDFALAHVAVARTRQTRGDAPGARDAMARAHAASAGLTPREQGHLGIFDLLISGKGADAYRATLTHILDYPRDALAVQPCLGVFGLIGFSGRPGREAEHLAFVERLAPHYGDDWWFLCMLAFAQMEAGQPARAEPNMERSLALHPRNANGSHYRAHLYYEVGEHAAGFAYLNDWRQDYGRDGLLHCHIAWHCALWAMAAGDAQTMWEIADANVDPASGAGPALNALTDMAALLYRAQLAGIEVPAERWRVVSDYARKSFPNPGIAFADIHAALAHAMAGNGEALETLITDAAGPAADTVRPVAEGFKAIAAQDWPGGIASLTAVMADHERLGGSRAQRDLIEHALAHALLRDGKVAEAKRLLAMHRPHTGMTGAIAGLQ